MKQTQNFDALDRALTDLHQADVPAGFSASWRDAVKREEPVPMQTEKPLSWLRRAALPIAAALVLITGTLVTGALTPPAQYDAGTAENETYDTDTTLTSSAADYGYQRSADVSFAPAPAPEYAADAAAKGAGETASGTVSDDRKIVRTVSLTLSTAAFEQDYAAVLALTQGAGGYVGSVSSYTEQAENRTASFDLRIPADRLESFLSGVGGIGRITERYETADDMTVSYTDTQLRLSNQRAKMTRLQELLAQAETVEDLLAVESEIANTQYEIDSLETSLRFIDRQVEYATVSVYLRERAAIDTAAAGDLTLGERIRSGLRASVDWLQAFFTNMLVFLAAAAPVLIPLVLLYVVFRLVRRSRHSHSKKDN